MGLYFPWFCLQKVWLAEMYSTNSRVRTVNASVLWRNNLVTQLDTKFISSPSYWLALLLFNAYVGCLSCAPNYSARWENWVAGYLCRGFLSVTVWLMIRVQVDDSQLWCSAIFLCSFCAIEPPISHLHVDRLSNLNIKGKWNSNLQASTKFLDHFTFIPFMICLMS